MEEQVETSQVTFEVLLSNAFKIDGCQSGSILWMETLSEEVQVLQAIYGGEIKVDYQSISPTFEVDKPADSQRMSVDVCLTISCAVNGKKGVEVYVFPPDEYPEKLAHIYVSQPYNGLQAEAEEAIKFGEGMPHLHLLMDWMKKSSLAFCYQESVKSKPEERSNQKICRYFLNGDCKFGSKCHNSHDTANQVCLTRNNTSSAECSAIHQKTDNAKNGQHSNILSLNEEDERADGGKKRSMRTASDVISRIQWDPSLDKSCFSVGYLDRFIGIVEKPFSAFSWEDIASVDYNVLSIPRHRIQYFKYKGDIVWDKPNRIDKVFGSSGASETILDIIEQSSSSINKTREEAEKETSRSGNEEHHDTGSDDEDIKESSRPKKDRRPNHFICFRIENAEIKSKVKQVQQELLQHDERLSEGFIDPEELHVTLCMLRIENEEEKDKVLHMLKEIQRLLLCMLPVTKKLNFDRLSNFKGRVLHVQLRTEPALVKLVELLLLKLKDADVALPGNYDVYTPHATIAKMSRPMTQRVNATEIYRKYYESLEEMSFGSQAIPAILLCSTSKDRGKDGFYITYGTYPNSYAVLGEPLQRLLFRRLDTLKRRGIVADTWAEKLKHNIEGWESVKVNYAVSELIKISDRELGPKAGNVVIMRGLPGSGKSFLVNNCQENKQNQLAVCSADHFFDSVRKDNLRSSDYQFNKRQLVKAHTACQEEFLKALEDQFQTIAIDNTNSQTWEYEIYKCVGQVLGYTVDVLELTCTQPDDLQFIIERGTHAVIASAVRRMLETWEPDRTALCLGVRDVLSLGASFSLVDVQRMSIRPQSIICHGKGILYSALYLNEASQEKLMRAYPPRHSKVSGSHLTLLYNPLPRQIRDIPVGTTSSVQVVGYLANDLIQAVVVKEHGPILCGMPIAHITLSTSHKAAPKHAADLLADRDRWQKPAKEIVLSGTVGVQVATSETKSESVVDIEVFKDVCSQLGMSLDCKALSSCYNRLREGNKSQEAQIVPYVMGRKLWRLFVFDFDGTLFDSPRPDEGRKLYELKTGEPWPCKGWLGQPQSLQYPLQCTPGPAFAAYQNLHGSAGSKSIVLTARIERMRHAVSDVLQEYGIEVTDLVLKPEVLDGRACRTVPRFKKNVVKGFLEKDRSVSEVRVWEDREENLQSIKTIEPEFREVAFDLIKVGEKDPNSMSCSDSMCTLETQLIDILQSYGVVFTPLFQSAVGQVLHFITEVWAAVLNIDMEFASHCVLPFGSCPLGRKGDLDLCLLAPKDLSHKECFEKLKTELEKRGVMHTHVAVKIRCPRFKLQLQFSSCAPLNVDVVLACCLTDADIISVDCDLSLWYEQASEKSKVALEGPLFLQSVLRAFSTRREREVLCIIVDFIVLFLEASHQKGNAYHCLRTFHILKAMLHMKANRTVNSTSLADFLLETISYFSGLGYEEWRELCGVFVPEEYFTPLQTSFKRAINALERGSSLWELLERSKFPPDDSLLVKIEAITDDDILQWKCTSLLEARVGTCVRKVLENGVLVFPGPARYGSRLTFAVEDKERSRMIVENALLDLRRDFDRAGHQQSVKIYTEIV